jgi:hypothetical protein
VTGLAPALKFLSLPVGRSRIFAHDSRKGLRPYHINRPTTLLLLPRTRRQSDFWGNFGGEPNLATISGTWSLLSRNYGFFLC